MPHLDSIRHLNFDHRTPLASMSTQDIMDERDHIMFGFADRVKRGSRVELPQYLKERLQELETYIKKAIDAFKILA